MPPSSTRSSRLVAPERSLANFAKRDIGLLTALVKTRLRILRSYPHAVHQEVDVQRSWPDRKLAVPPV
jgi:hypothetical protein